MYSALKKGRALIVGFKRFLYVHNKCANKVENTSITFLNNFWKTQKKWHSTSDRPKLNSPYFDLENVWNNFLFNPSNARRIPTKNTPNKFPRLTAYLSIFGVI